MPRGIQIHDTVAVGGQGGAGATTSSGKGKEKEVSTRPVPKACSRSPSSNTGGRPISLPSKKGREDVLRRWDLCRGPLSVGQQVPSKVVVGQVHDPEQGSGVGELGKKTAWVAGDR
jgi:hypothetical protein